MRKIFSFLLHSFFILFPFWVVYFFLIGSYDIRYLKIFYVLNLLALVPLFIHDFRHKQFLGFWIFILPLIYTTVWIPLGLDLTDEAYNTVLAWFYPIKDNPMTIYTPLALWLNHLWLHIFHYPFVLWQKLGLNLILSTVLYTSFVVLKFYIPENKIKKNWLVILLIYLAMGIMSYQFHIFKSYDYVPVALSAIFIALVYSAIKRDRKILFLFSGLVFVFVLYSRFVYFFIFPLIPLLIFITYKVKFSRLVYFILGSVLGLVIVALIRIDLFYAFAIVVKLLKGTIPTSICFYHQSYRLTELAKLYIREGLVVLFLTAFFTILFLLTQKFNFSHKFTFFKKWQKNMQKIFLLLWLLILVFFSFNMLLYPHNYWRWFVVSFSLVNALIINVLLLKRELFQKTKDFIFVSMIFMLLSFLGSNVGVEKIQKIYVSAFVSPIFIFMGYKHLNKAVLWTVLFFVSLFGIKQNLLIQRDYSVKYLTKEFSLLPLKGIYSTPFKVKEIEDFYNSVKDYDFEDYNFIASNKTFLYVILLNKIPNAFCWYVDKEKLEDRIKKGKVKYIFWGNRYFGDYFWDKTNRIADRQCDIDRLNDLKKYLDDNFIIKATSKHNIFILYQVK